MQAQGGQQDVTTIQAAEAALRINAANENLHSIVQIMLRLMLQKAGLCWLAAFRGILGLVARCVLKRQPVYTALSALDCRSGIIAASCTALHQALLIR